jgi:rhodanese-related sulfurtransferase
MIMVLAAPVCIWLKNVQAMEFHEINAVELKSKIEAGEKLILINPLSKIEFDAKHIPGSVNIPLPDIRTTAKLPKDKNQLIITYCLGRN